MRMSLRRSGHAGSEFYLVGIVFDLVVVPCGRVPRKPGLDADRCAVDRSGLNDVRAFHGNLLGALVAGTDDGDVTGLVVAMIVIAGDDQQTAVGGGLRLRRAAERTPAFGA